MNERRQNRRGRSSEEANAQYPGLAARSSLRHTLRFIGTLQDIHDFMQESRSRGCKRDTPFGTKQQLHSEFILKIQNRLANRRLGNVQAARCFAVVQVPEPQRQSSVDVAVPPLVSLSQNLITA